MHTADSRYKGHRSQVTENAIKKLDTLLGVLCLCICFVSGYVTIRHMFGIDHASRSRSKRSKWRKLHTVLELEELLLIFGCLETWKRDFVFAPCEETWKEVLRGKCLPNYRLYCSLSCRFWFVATYIVSIHC